MTLTRLPIEVGDGLMLDATAAEAEGRWHDGARVRFVRGRPQTIGGWQRRLPTALDGRPRALHAWINRTREQLLGVGTHTKLYVLRAGAAVDITPVGLAPGNADAGGGGGFGEGLFGTGAFGQGAVGSGVLRTWSLNNWGDDLIANPRGGGLFRWQGVNATPAAIVGTAPSVIDSFFVDPNGYVVLLGAQSADTGQFDPMLVRWGDQNSLTLYAPSATNKAGEFRLAEGGRIVAGRAASPSLIWTDTALYEMRLIDAELVFGFPLVATGCGLIGPNAVAERDGLAWWMAPNGQFFEYAGSAPTPIPCPLLSSVFDNLNRAQADKVATAINGAFNEVWWFYPDLRDGDGRENSRYAAFNWIDRTWSSGPLDRSCWLDAGVFSGPVAAAPGGLIYDHEVGASADGGPIGDYIISGGVDLGDGDALMRIDGLLPDLKNLLGVAQVSVLMRGGPTGDERVFGPFAIGPATQRIAFQSLGRIARLRVAGASTPSFWRLGDPRWDVKQTGMRQ